ncbi:DNA translocase FtsK [Bacillus thuringiensis]|nr:DNA translocase FtsK [Bacillus thuringiensis]
MNGNLYPDFEERYQEAVQIVKETKQCPTSMLQRKLRCGYIYAARLIDRMVQEGVVSSFRGSEPRGIYI